MKYQRQLKPQFMIDKKLTCKKSNWIMAYLISSYMLVIISCHFH